MGKNKIVTTIFLLRFFGFSVVVYVAAGLLLTIIPTLPAIFMVIVGIGLIAVSFIVSHKKKRAEAITYNKEILVAS